MFSLMTADSASGIEAAYHRKPWLGHREDRFAADGPEHWPFKSRTGKNYKTSLYSRVNNLCLYMHLCG